MKKAKKIFFIIFTICVVVFSIGISILAADTCNCGNLHDWGKKGGEDQYFDYTVQEKYITYLPSEEKTWNLGEYMGLGVSTTAGAVLKLQVDGYKEKQLVHVGKFMPDFLARSNKEFFCIEHGQGSMAGKLRYVAKIDIIGDAVKAQLLDKTTLQGINSNDARKNTRILVKILKDAKSAKGSTYSYNGQTYHFRDRGEESGGNFSYQRDTYQRILWKHFNGWRNTTLGEGKITEIGTNTDTTGSDDNSNHVEIAAENQANILYQKLLDDTTVHKDGVVKEASIGIKDESVSTKLKIKNTIGTNTILGPFKYNYTGKIKSYKIYFNNNTNNVTSTQIGTYSGSTFTNCSTIPDNSDFYVKVPTSYLTAEIQTLNIKVELSASEDKTTLYILRSVASGQHQMYVQQSTVTLTDSKQFKYEIERPRTVTLKKKSTEGENLAEVKFKLYDENNKYINTYTTGTAGTVQIPNIEIGKKYILEETSSKAYGTKGTNIANATIDKGTILERDKENRKIKFNIQDNATLEITNAVELGKLTIRKVDETTGKEVLLEDVEFILWEMTGGYIRLFDKNTSKFINEIKPEVDEEIDIMAYRVEHVLNISKDTPATRFITNSNGEIVIKNLEIYVSATMKNHYVASEVENNNYGYKGIVLESGNIEMSEDKTRIIKEGNVRIEDGSLAKFEASGSCIRQADKSIKFNINKDTILTINNVPKLGNLKIIKTGTDGKIQQGVEFELWQEVGGYVRLFIEGETGLEFVDTVKSENGEPIDLKKYVIKHVSEVTQNTLPTRFITDKDGQIQINNIEIYRNPGKLNYHFISEVKNDNYGYKGMTIENAIIEGGTLSNFDNTQSYIRQRDRAVKFMITKNATLTIKNKPQLGNMLIHKQSTNGSVLKDVEFIISRGENEYIVLKDSKGNNLNPNKINEEAIIDLDGSFGKNEYSITYSNDKEEATVFITGEEGTINIKNLEVYQPYKISRSNTGVVNTQPTLYEYTLHEVANPNYGYVLMNTENLKLNLIAGETKEEKLYNKQIYTKLSGYVWIEKKDYSKDNAYDLLYNESTADIKLTDLYITNGDGKLKRNLNAMVPVKILLRNTTTKEIREPDEYIYQGEKDKNINDAGKYTFIDVEIEKLSEYEIVFEYDGFYYSTIIPKIEANNGSKVKENEEDRTLLNQKFGTVESGDKIVSKNGKTEKVIYGEVENCNSELLGFETANLTKVQAKTIVGISEMFNDAQGGIVDNINMGLLERDQPILWIDNNISNVKVNLNVNGEENTYTYNYKDGERVFLNEEYYYEKIDGEYKPVKVNKEDEETILLKDELEEGIKTSSIPQTIVKSDLSAAIKDKNDGIEMGVSMIYKISVNNSSGKLTSVVHKIKNYFDSRYIIEEIGLSINNNVIGDIIYKANPEGHFEGELVDITLKENVGFTYDAGITPVENLKYNSVIIPLGKDGIRLKSLESRNIYIKYRLNDTALEDLINGETYYNNAAEIIKYSTYYEDSVGTGLVKDENNKITKMDISTENIKGKTRRTGEIYAGITLGNRPDNIELKLIKHEDVLKFDDSKYEIDSKEAQTLILDAEGVRTISGNIFEDSASRTGDNQWIADGKFDKNSESGISNVKVELYNVGNNGAIGSKATYANNEPVVAEAIDGKYKLGGYTDGAGNVYGILPGKYIIQYTYGSYDDKQTFINDEDNTIIDVMEYKSTIISEDNPLKTEFKNNVDKTEINKSWFLLQGENYSAAIDNLRLRAEYLAPIEENTVNYGKLRGSGMKILKEDGTIDYQDGEIDMMTAQTLPMNVNIHFTAEDNAEVIKKDENGQIKHENPSTELENVNFGIVERPKIDIKINKEITEIEVIAQNGASVIPKGNPRKSKMSYIAAPQNEKSITAQIDPKLLQGATLNLEYTVTVENNSNIDYICEEYYYFGEKKEEFKNTPNAKLVVDYLDATMELDETKTENAIWKKESADLLKSGEYINSDVHTALTKNGENKTYYAYTTSAFEEVNIGEEPKSEKMYISKKLSISEDIKETNRVEIIEISGRRAITGAVPGNYNPSELVGTSGDLGYMSESDWSKDEVNFMPPTGTIVDYGMYTIAAVVMFTILTIGIIVIKKKVII